MSEQDRNAFVKRVVELPDGRRLIYYDFDREPSLPPPSSPSKERGEKAAEES
jgi:hypothetical protein